MHLDQIARVRRFNRLVTQRVGALSDHFLGRKRSLGASRLLYEIGPSGADLRELRNRLGLDSGYLSRLLQSLTRQQLIRVRPSKDDRRVRRAELTARGLSEYRELDRRSDELVVDLFATLAESQRARLLTAMTEVERLLWLAGVHFERVHPADEAARWCLKQYFSELNRRFEHGFDLSRSLHIDDEDFVPPKGAFVVGTVNGEAIACGGVKPIAPNTGYLKRMWVAESARGLGLGRRVLSELETAALSLGYTKLVLETNRALTEAIALYKSAGYRPIEPFNHDEGYADFWFEKQIGN